MLEATPAPWVQHDRIKHKMGVLITDESGATGIARVLENDGNIDLCHANARLIAAAPKLLAALKLAKQYVALCTANKITRTKEGIQAACEAFKKVEAAIAEAEGK